MGSENNNAKNSQNIYRDAWNKGVQISQDRTFASQEQRVIVAKRIKVLRTEKGLSQEKLADMINANFLTYKGYENCRSDIPLFYLVRIADTLDTTLDYLAGRTDVQDATSTEHRLRIVEEWIKSQTEKE